MKIVEVESFEIHPPLQAWNEDAHRLYQGGTWDARTIVVLRADNGLEGLGEYEGPPNERMQGELERLKGTNPCQWLAHPRLNIWLAPAIYDLVAQAEGVPVYQLLGPKVRSWVPVSSWTVSQTPAKMAEEVQRAAAAGYTWLKYHTHHFHNAIDQTRAMQEVAPRGFKIHYDVNFDNTVDQVVELARELAQFPVAGLIEDPLRTFLWAEDVVTPALAVVSGQVRVPEVPGLGVKLDRQALVRLQARQVPPLPKALVRIAHWNGPTSYARPPLSRNPLLDEREVPGHGEGYNLPLDQDYWYDDGSERFARLWEQAGKGLVVEAGPG